MNTKLRRIIAIVSLVFMVIFATTLTMIMWKFAIKITTPIAVTSGLFGISGFLMIKLWKGSPKVEPPEEEEESGEIAAATPRNDDN